MNRQEKITEAQNLENEIREIKDFMQALEYENTIHRSSRFSTAMVKVSVVKSFFCVWSNRKDTVVRIPEKLTIEISAKCQTWINELNRRADLLVVSDNKIE